MKIFNRYKINDLELKNRLVMPPMCTYQVFNGDGKATNFHQAHYIARAIGQVGFIIVEATGISENGRITNNCLGLYNNEQINPLKEIVKAVHQHGSKIAIQLNHAGRKSQTTTSEHVSSSLLPFNDNPIDYKMLTADEIQEIILQFKEAALRADKAGFDAIELHGAQGYLIHQFLSPLSNNRKDEYGLDRFLFLKQIVTEVRTIWPKEKPLLLRISATDYLKDGLIVEDWIKFLNEHPDLFDMIHVSSGGLLNAPIKLYPGYQLPFASLIKEKTNYPTIGVGLVNEIELICNALEMGTCDLIACGRELLKNPNLYLDIAKKYKRDDLIPFVYKRAYR